MDHLNDINDDDSSDNASEEGCIMESLFTCEQYILRSWKFPIMSSPLPSSSSSSSSNDSTLLEIEQKLLCSNQSSTDRDLTGQIVWPAATMLCYFIAKNHNTIFQNTDVIELGAGNS